MSLKVDWCSFEAARHAVMKWHYSRAMPASKLVKIGAWEDGEFIGAVIFAYGATRHLVKPYGLEPHEGCELVRVALRMHKTPVSQIVGIALRMVKRKYPGLKLIVSFADPRQGHVGKIYQAGNWVYAGMTATDRFPVIDGQVRHPRTLSSMIERNPKIDRRSFQYVEVPGKHRYLYPLTEGMRERIAPLSQPYPK